MKLNPLFNYTFILFFFSSIFAAVLNPIQNAEPEILEISSKDREYHVIRTEPLLYEIEGPKLLTIFLRKPIPKLEKDSVYIHLNIQLDNYEPFKFESYRSPSSSVRSKRHPGHVYTSTVKYMVQVPAGFHHVKLSSSNSNPVLVRVINKSKPKRKSGEIVVSKSSGMELINLITGKRVKDYYQLEPENEISFLSAGTEGIWVYTRFISDKFTPEMTAYTLQVQDGSSKPFPVMFFNEMSQQSELQNHQGFPGKFNTLYFKFDDEGTILRFKNTSDLTLLLRAERVQLP